MEESVDWVSQYLVTLFYLGDMNQKEHDPEGYKELKEVHKPSVGIKSGNS